jgi:hypothetical protein
MRVRRFGSLLWIALAAALFVSGGSVASAAVQPSAVKGATGSPAAKSKAVFDAERELSRQAQAAYRHLVSDWRPNGPTKTGAGVTPGAHL